ncbi:RapZ C-terminal domain-containing protein [Streptomyces xiamenensis]|uniref:RapZ C-terminal domain-containing protein n=1 Tax=Streptomyces xiamenensis TaxID=408015 RepID=UPI0035E2BDB6
MNPITVTITSFGYLHAAPPAAHLTFDLRQHFKDPHVAPELRHRTAEDQVVREAVLRTAGIPQLLTAIATAANAYLSGPSADTVATLDIATGCAGGRHRAGTTAMVLAAIMAGDQDQLAYLTGGQDAARRWELDRLARWYADRPYDVHLVHRDMHRAVVAR